MTLLTDVMNSPLDPGYALAAAARLARGAPRRRMVAATLLLAVLCGWGVSWAVIQLRRPLPGAVLVRQRLVAEIQSRISTADRQQAANQTLRAQIAAAQAQVLRSAGNADLAAQVTRLGMATGETPVTGPGLEIVLDDAPEPTDTSGLDPRATVAANPGRVLDRDLQIVANGLWASGAEAIAINGQRLTGLSAIRSAGQAVLVDFRPLSPPYTLQAIGNATGLQSRFALDMAGSYVQTLHNTYGIAVTITPRTSMSLPGAGALVLHEAQPLATTAPAVTASAVTPEVSP